MKKLFVAILIVFLIYGFTSGNTKDKQTISVLKEGKKLFKSGQYKKCLNLINVRISHKPEELKKFSNLKLKVLKKLGLYRKAINLVLEVLNLTKDKVVHNSIELGGLYMKLSDFDNAFKWFNTAVDNGFAFYPPFEFFDEFKQLRKDTRFLHLLNRMKDKQGIGKPIKQFKRNDINGKLISPELFKNTVLLIDFWETKCKPCMDEMANLKQIYNDFNKKGFALISISLDYKRKKIDKYIKDFEPPCH